MHFPDGLYETMMKASAAYYNGEPLIMSDEEWDAGKRVLDENGVQLPVGDTGLSPKSNRKVLGLAHTFENLAGTLAKVTTEATLLEWVDKTVPYGCMVGISHKIDGNSVTLNYDLLTLQLVSAVTRGEDGVGIDLTDVFADRNLSTEMFAFSEIVYTKEKPMMAIKCEAAIKFSDLERYSKVRDKVFANPRSVIGGLLSKSEAAQYREFIALFPLELRADMTLDGLPLDSGIHRVKELEILSNIHRQGHFEKLPYAICKASETKSVKELVSGYYHHIPEIRSELDVMIDGMVVEILDSPVRERLGRTDGTPAYAVAAKFPPVEKPTVVTGIHYDMGASGRFTPVVEFTPVCINGAMYDNVSLFNVKSFNALKFGVGSHILFSLRNDVLGYVYPMNTPEPVVPFQFLTHCTVCNAPLSFEGDFAFCRNPECEGCTGGRISRFLEKIGAMDIGEFTIDNIVKFMKISSEQPIRSFYEVFINKDLRNQAMQIRGLGKDSITNAAEELLKNTPIADFKFIAGFKFANVGRTIWKEVLKKHSLQDFLDGKVTSLNDIENIGTKRNEVILNGVRTQRDEILSMMELFGNRIVLSTQGHVAKDALKIVITGDVAYPGSRDGLSEYIESLGHRVIGSISKQTSCLVCNAPSNTTKFTKAKALGVPIINEKQLLELLADPSKITSYVNS